MEDKKEDKAISDALNTMNEAEASYGLRVWFGAIFFYLVKRGKVPFEELHNKKHERRNVITGYFLVLFLVALGIYLTWKIMEYQVG